ncbi:hypothetical protein BGZ83_010686 [Gryganskiella cystojenkinii]|nr:hypothetical protein BGZ83_010686 [Gryganskiella cystojenkinii]
MAIAMRMIDLYFVRPRRQDIQAQQNNKKSDNHVDTTKSKSSPLMWDSIQLNAELWSPLRKISSTHVSSYDATKPGLIPLRQLLKQVGLYLLISDLTIFLASRFTLQDLPSLSLIQYGLFLCLFGFIHFAVLLLYNLVAVTWSLATGHRVDPEEWILISKPLPYFAKTPAEFWALWHSLFRTIWVDLGFLPAQNFAKRHLGPDRLGPQLARVVRLSLPVMAVFTLSGILHGYVVLATWRENPWSQVVYFLIQGVVVILTKAIEQSAFGLILQKKYHQGTHLQRTLMKISGILLTWCLHIITAPFFLHPYLQNEIWLTVTKGSVLWNLFG